MRAELPYEWSVAQGKRIQFDAVEGLTYNLIVSNWDVSAGVLECSGCRNPESEGLRIPITPGTLDAMRYIVSCNPKRLFRFGASEDTLERLAQITETYLTTQLERGFSTLDFYKSLLLPC